VAGTAAFLPGGLNDWGLRVCTRRSIGGEKGDWGRSAATVPVPLLSGLAAIAGKGDRHHRRLGASPRSLDPSLLVHPLRVGNPAGPINGPRSARDPTESWNKISRAGKPYCGIPRGRVQRRRDFNLREWPLQQVIAQHGEAQRQRHEDGQPQAKLEPSIPGLDPGQQTRSRSNNARACDTNRSRNEIRPT